MSEVSGSARLVSGEAVELDVRVARLGSRLVAFAIDFPLRVILTLVVLVVLLLSAWVSGVAANVPEYVSTVVPGVWTVAIVTGFIVMPALEETIFKGRSLGKRALGLRVVRDDGGAVRFRHALTRSLTAAGVEFPGFLLPGVTWFASIGVMLFHPAGKRVGDLAAGTIVIHERTPDAPFWRPAMPAGLGSWAVTADLTGLDDNLALAIRHFLARNHDIGEPARTRLGATLASELAMHVTPPPPLGTPGWAFLTAVLAERNRRAGGRLAAHRETTAQVWETLYGPARGQSDWGRAPWTPTPVSSVPPLANTEATSTQ